MRGADFERDFVTAVGFAVSVGFGDAFCLEVAGLAGAVALAVAFGFVRNFGAAGGAFSGSAALLEAGFGFFGETDFRLGCPLAEPGRVIEEVAIKPAFELTSLNRVITTV
jgi:hypothetical protein